MVMIDRPHARHAAPTSPIERACDAIARALRDHDAVPADLADALAEHFVCDTDDALRFIARAAARKTDLLPHRSPYWRAISRLIGQTLEDMCGCPAWAIGAGAGLERRAPAPEPAPPSAPPQTPALSSPAPITTAATERLGLTRREANEAADAARDTLRRAIDKAGGIDEAARVMRSVSTWRTISECRLILLRLLSGGVGSTTWWLASKSLGFTLPLALQEHLGPSPAYAPKRRTSHDNESRARQRQAMRGLSAEERAKAEAERKARWAQARAEAERRRQAEEARRMASIAANRAASEARKMLRDAIRRARLTASAVISAMCAVDPARPRAWHSQDLGSLLRRNRVRHHAWWIVSRALGLDLPPALAQAIGPCPSHLLATPDLDAIPAHYRPKRNDPPPNRWSARMHECKRVACDAFARLLAERGLSAYKLAKLHIKDDKCARSVASSLHMMATMSPLAPVCSPRWRTAARWLGVPLSTLCPDPEWLALQPQEEPAQ